MSNCEIHLDDYTGLYFPGKSVTGRVKCLFTQTENISGISITLTGSEYTTWTEWKGREKKRGRPTHYRGNNDFLVVNSTLTEAGDVGPGRFEYPFALEIPENLPGTYNGKYGWVKYILKATLGRPDKSDYVNEKEIKIVSLINFNRMKNRLPLEPSFYSEKKDLCCWCCSSGPIVMNVQLEKTAFVAGETVRVDVDITNSSRTNVSLVAVEIGMAVISRVKTPNPYSKQDYELLAIAREPGVRSHRSHTYSINLEIPQTSGIPNFQGCSLFDQRSTLKVTALLPIWFTDLQVPIRIMVGDVPIGQDISTYQERILQQVSHLLPSPLPLSEPEEQSPEWPIYGPPEHVTLPAGIPPPLPHLNVESYPLPSAPYPLSPNLTFDFYPPPLGHITLSPIIIDDEGGESPLAGLTATSDGEARK